VMRGWFIFWRFTFVVLLQLTLRCETVFYHTDDFFVMNACQRLLVDYVTFFNFLTLHPRLFTCPKFPPFIYIQIPS
jgi:hypothetical protein